MIELEDLTHAYVAAHPVDAARELERLEVAEAAALFEQVPARLTAPVLQSMLPPAAARCLVLLSPARAVLLLGTLGAPAAASILRHLSETARKGWSMHFRPRQRWPVARCCATRTMRSAR